MRGHNIYPSIITKFQTSTVEGTSQKLTACEIFKNCSRFTMEVCLMSSDGCHVIRSMLNQLYFNVAHLEILK